MFAFKKIESSFSYVDLLGLEFAKRPFYFCRCTNRTRIIRWGSLRTFH